MSKKTKKRKSAKKPNRNSKTKIESTKGTSTGNEEKKKTNIIHEEIETFVNHLDALYGSIPLTMSLSQTVKEQTEKEYNNYIKDKGKEGYDGEKNFYRLAQKYRKKADSYQKLADESRIAFQLLPQSYIVSLISQYDAYLGRLIKCLYRIKPELLNSSDKQISFSDLSTFASVEDAREHLLENETESLLRKSHHEQFDWLENKFNIPLKKNLDIWPTFIEITQRRNLFVHCNGEVSNQYINVCKKKKVENIDKIRPGEKLQVDPEYINSAYKCLYEIGVKLANVLWRKILHDEIETADASLIYIVYNLLYNEDYELAKKLLDFAVLLPKHSNEEHKRMFIINRAQSYKFTKDKQKSDSILNEYDWSACSDKFKVCLYSLKEDYDRAAEIMHKIGKSSEVEESNYLEWPVFKEFRESKQFRKAFESILGKPVVTFSKIKEENKSKEKV